MARRPSFLLFVTDQHRADHLGCYGNVQVQTPHIDALAAQGCRFDDFHVATPICQPNRASLMTGRLPSVHGLQMNGRELSHRERTFVQTLREAGWRTALVGKSHLQNITTGPTAWPATGRRLPHEAVRAHPGAYGQEVWKRWEDDPGFELELPYYGFDQVTLTIGHADQQHGHWRRWLRQQTPDADQLIGPANAIPTPGYALASLGQAWRTRVPEELYPTRFIAEQTCTVLDQVAQGDAPFFIQCSFPDPHHPFTPPGRYWDLVDPDAVALPASFHAPLVDPPPAIPWLRAQRQGNAAFRPGFGSFACTEQEAREAIALNHGSLANIDDAIGRVMAHLRALGREQDTVVMFTSDHGDLLGDRGLLFKGGLHYTALTRVPFVWRDPQQPPQHRASLALAQTIDIAPTVLSRAGLSPANGMQGRSLLPVIDGTQAGVRDHVLIEEESQRSDFGLDRRLRMRTVRNQRHRLTVYDGQPWGELVDLEQDPLELRNLWNDPAALPLRQRMAEQLAHAMLAMTDDSPYPDAAA
ncbi:MAG: sulfatase-like hydrolase/transferase [Burkholderiaceae bacterium]